MTKKSNRLADRKDDVKIGDLVYAHEWDLEGGIGIVIGIDGEWDDGEPPGVQWVTYLEIQFQDGEIAFWDHRMCSPLE